MKTTGSDLIFSPSDLNAYLECEHLTMLELAVARRELEWPEADNLQADLVKRKGDEHERAYLQRLQAESKSVVTIGGGSEAGDGSWDLEAAARATEEAMRSGADIVYQAVLLDGDWRGFADFLERVPGESDLGDFHYEVSDTKLARHSKPKFLLQLCFYSAVVARIQERQPEQMHLVLGDDERESFRVDDFDAYYRRVRGRFLDFMTREPETYPLPVPYCDRCDWLERCTLQWEADDHLTLVAGLRRDQAARLEPNGVATLAQLAEALPDTRPASMQPRTWESLNEQAALQLHHRRHGEHITQLLEPEPLRGFALLPPTSPGDLFFDIEGDPFFEASRGLEYLWGMVDTERNFTLLWAHDREQEKRALEEFVDLVHEGLLEHPDMHVYHYASYETAVLRRLMSEYGTREDEIDDLLRREIFVDLYKVVRQSLRSSHPNYSLKSIENFYMTREADLRSGDDSIVLYEQWTESHDPQILQAIHDYNEEDCLSTLDLRDWLLGLRAEAVKQFGEIPWFGVEPPSEPEETAAETAELRARLEADPTPERVLMSRLLDYHRREARPVWWAFFARRGQTPEALAERDGDSIGMLELVSREDHGDGELVTFSFPAQQHKLSRGQQVHDPNLPDGPVYAGSTEALDDERGTLVLYRSKNVREHPLPQSLIPGGPLPTKAQRAALRRLAESIVDGTNRYPALEAILRRDLPRIAGHAAGDPLPQDDLEAAKRLAVGLDGSYLVVQGPPGSGKTYTGARLIVELIGRGRRVGVSATSHKSIENLLREVEKVALAAGVRFRGFKKGGGDYEGPFVHSSGKDADFEEPEDVLLLAGTAWLFAKRSMEGVVDTLVIDEAGQVSLADALAIGTCARNLILLGDPQQLAQVSQGRHPEGAELSVLEHLLAGEDTIPPEHGLFLGETWRMHPKITEFVSQTSYAGRLHSAKQCARQRVESPGLSGAGLRYLPVEHPGNRGQSPEEAERIAHEIELLVQGRFVDCRGDERPLTYKDILVVAPYNAQVRCLRTKLPAAVRVGTVDKFQGQEAPVVFFSMATSSGEDLPRNLEFLFSRNRLNVAISRAQALAVLVCSPRLLEINCRTIEQMRMVNALCRLVEVAEA
jgi:predicted RecB family nuclease